MLPIRSFLSDARQRGWIEKQYPEGAFFPRENPFRIELTDEERQELESRVRKYTSPYRDVIRAKIVLLSAESLAKSSVNRGGDFTCRVCLVGEKARGFTGQAINVSGGLQALPTSADAWAAARSAFHSSM